MTDPLRYGATAEEWSLFSLVLGLTSDLLPVVSNPTAKISSQSKLKSLGKTPSKYNKHGEVGGIVDWPQHVATLEDIKSWSRHPDYGICIITRNVRAIDVDVTDGVLALEIQRVLRNQLPLRYREGAAKFLVCFEMPGDYAKRVIKTRHGIIEFLATGQQFIAAGTHPSGSRYQWRGLDAIPLLAPVSFEDLWSTLQDQFGIEPSTTSTTSTRKEQLNEAISQDPTAQFLREHHFILSSERDGRLHIQCPFADQHTSGDTESATSYFPANTGGFAQGHFKCLHAHCAARTDSEFREALGISAADDFEALPEKVFQAGSASQQTGSANQQTASRYTFVKGGDFSAGAQAPWIVKGILPEADLGVVFGESGSGKSFWTLDLCYHIARGLEWRGHRVRQGDVAYVIAEGSNGFKNRMRAYAAHNSIDDLNTVPLWVLAAQPNFMHVDHVRDVKNAVLAVCKPKIIVVDTFAQVIPGANENSGEDVGRALGHCRGLHNMTGAMILLIHHSGKDSTKGARGWSGLRAAADAEIEITRLNHERAATITKLKDGTDNEQFGFKLVTVNLGDDDEGEAVTSCVVEPTTQAVQRAQRVKLGDVERVVMQVLEDTDISGDGEIDQTTLHEHAAAHMPFNPKRDQRSAAINRALSSLATKGLIETFNGKVRKL